MRRKFLFILLALTMLGTITYFYINNIFIPVQFKKFVTKKAEELIDRRVTIGRINFQPIKGFTIEDVVVFQKDPQDKPLIKIEETSFNILLAPIFKNKHIVIPTIKINSPYVYIVREKQNEWNVSDILVRKKEPRDIKAFSPLDKKSLPAKFFFYFRKIKLENGALDFIDKTQEKEFSESLQDISLDITLTLDKTVHFALETRIPKRDSSLYTQGSYEIPKKKYSSKISLNNFYLADYLALFYAGQELKFKDGIISSAAVDLVYQNRNIHLQGDFSLDDADIQTGNNREFTGNIKATKTEITWLDNKLDAQGHFLLTSADIIVAPDNILQGDLSADLKSLKLFNKNFSAQGDLNLYRARLMIDDDKDFRGNATVTNASLSKLDEDIHLQGDLVVNDTDFRLGADKSLKGDISGESTNLVYRDQKLDIQSKFNIQNADIILGHRHIIRGNISAPNAQFSYQDKQADFQGQVQIENADISMDSDKRFQGNPNIEITYHYNADKEDDTQYSGSLNLLGASLIGMPYLKEMRNIRGNIIFETNQIETEDLSFSTQGTDIQISGSLTNFTEPSLEIKASSDDIDIENIFSLFPNLYEKTKINLSGHASVKAKYKGPIKSAGDPQPPLSPPKSPASESAVQNISEVTTTIIPDSEYQPLDWNIKGAEVAWTVKLWDAAVSSDRFPQKLKDVAGQIDYSKDRLTWQNLRGHYQGNQYTLNGELKNFSRPTIDTTIKSGKLDLSTQIKILRKAFQVIFLTGDYLNSYFDIRGDVHFFENSDPDIDLRGKFALDLRDLEIFAPNLKAKINKFNPTGVLSGESIYKGKFKDWRNWQLAFTAQSNKISLKEYPFEDVKIQFTQRDQHISKLDIISKFYDGHLNIVSSVDLIEKAIPIKFTLDLGNLNLAQLRKDRKLRNQYLAGNLSMHLDMNGLIKDLNGWAGKGALSISEGYLWQWNLLEGISSTLLIPEFRNVVFTDGRADFIIQNKKILTQNAELNSKTVNLRGKGWFDFSKNINFELFPIFSELTILRSDSLRKGPTSFLTQTEGYIVIKLTGTLDDPKYRVETFPGKILEKTTDILKEGFESIFEDFF